MRRKKNAELLPGVPMGGKRKGEKKNSGRGSRPQIKGSLRQQLAIVTSRMTD